MKKINFLFAIFSVLGILVLLAGCPDSISPVLNGDADSPAPGNGFVRLQFSVGGISTGAERTLLPNNLNFAGYEFKFMPDIGNTNPAKTFYDYRTKYELAQGDWKLTVKAYSDAGRTELVAESPAVPVSVGSSPADVEVPMVFVPFTGSETGNLSYEITYGTSLETNLNASNQLEIKLKRLDNPGEVYIGKLKQGSRSNIPAGFYLATVRLEEYLITPLAGGEDDWIADYGNGTAEWMPGYSRVAGINRWVWSDILHIYPGQTTALEYEFDVDDFYNDINNIWLFGHMTNWDLYDSGYVSGPYTYNWNDKKMTKNTDGTFSWEGPVNSIDRYFRFALTDTSQWTPREDANLKKGAWLIPLPSDNGATINSSAEKETDFLQLHTGGTKAEYSWQLDASGDYYKITVNPVTRKFTVEKPDIVAENGVSINGGNTGVYIYDQKTFTAAVAKYNAASTDVTWSIIETGTHANTSIGPTTGILAIDGAEAKSSLTIRATSAATNKLGAYEFDEITVTVNRPVVNTITVSPNGITADQGTQKQFSASVTFIDTSVPTGVPKTVSWSVELVDGTKKSGTTISSSGLLTIAADEPKNGVLKIIATSNYDTGKTGFATLTVTEPQPDPTVTSVTINENYGTVLRNKTYEFTVTMEVSGGAEETVAWSLSGNDSPSTVIDSDGKLFIAANETQGKTLTITATSNDPEVLVQESDSVTVTVFTQVPLAKPTNVSLGNDGEATWTKLANQDNATHYRVRLYKGTDTSTTAIKTVDIPKAEAATTDDFLLKMQTAATEGPTPVSPTNPVSFNVTVEALSSDTANYPDSGETAVSASTTKEVTKRPAVEHTWWNGNENARWQNPSGHVSTDTYTVKLYKKTLSSTHPASTENDLLAGGETVNVRYNIPGESNTDATEWYIPGSNVPSDSSASYYFTVALKGDDLLVLDSPIKISGAGTYNVFGTSMIRTISEGTVDAAKRYIAGAEHGKIAWSDNGQTWTMANQNAFQGNTVNAIAHDGGSGKGRFVAVGNGGKAATSEDGGKNWTPITIDTDNPDLFSIAYGDNKFLVGAQWGRVHYSPSVITDPWPIATGVESSLTWGDVVSIIYDTTLGFTAFANNQYSVSNPNRWRDSSQYARSTNGTSGWSMIARNIDNIDNDYDSGQEQRVIKKTAFGNGRFAVAIQGNAWLPSAVGQSSSTLDFGNGWREHFIETNIEGIVYGYNKFVAYGPNGKVSTATNTSLAATSNSWTALTTTAANPFHGTTDTITAAHVMSDGKLILASYGKILVSQ